MTNQHCIYLRKSRADADAELRGEGETLARHRKILLDVAHNLQLNVTKEYAEIVSGETIAARPVMQQLLSDVEQGMWQGVLVVEVERLARGATIDQGIMAQTFKYSNTKIITPMKTYDPNNDADEEYFEFSLFMSRREYKTINRRLQQGRAASAREGRFAGSIPPYGYIKKRLDKGFTLEPHPEQAEIVKLIFQLYIEGNGQCLISTKLNDLKTPPAHTEWNASTIRGILKNPVYAGKIRWNRRQRKKKMLNGQVIVERPVSFDVILVNGLHPAIVSEDMFNQVQQTFNSITPLGTVYKLSNPLAGIVVCGKCGRKMQSKNQKGRYDCVILCPSTTCDNIGSYYGLVESRILSSLSDWLQNYDIDLNKPVPKKDFLKALKPLESELAGLQKQKDNLHDLLERGIYDEAIFLNRSRVLANKISQAEASKELLLAEMKKEEQRETAHTTLLPKIKHLLDVYAGLSIKGKNDMLKDVLEKVVYEKTVRGIGNQDNFIIKLYPKVPFF